VVPALRPVRAALGTGAILVLLGPLGPLGCSDDGGRRDPVAFCERLRQDQAGLTDPSDPVRLVALYEDLDARAPLQIRDEWSELTSLVALVTTYDAADPEATQEVLRQSLRAQGSVTAVAEWVQSSCEVELGPIPATVPIGGTGDSLLSE
jgi:hypothetical protein